MEKRFEKQILESETSLKNYLYKKCGDWDLAQDLFQNLFIRVHNKLQEGKFDEGKDSNFLGWVSTIARNMTLDLQRFNQKYLVIGEAEFNNPDGPAGNIAEYLWDRECDTKADQLLIDADKELEHNINKIKIDAAKSHLNSVQYLVLTLRNNDYSFKQIAEITGVNINTSLAQMRYSKQNFVKQFKEKRLREKRRKRFKEGRAGTFPYDKLLVNLPPYQFFAVMMKKSGVTFSEIAELEGVPTSTVYYRFIWAKKNLKKMAESEEDYNKITEYIDGLNTNVGGKNWHRGYKSKVTVNYSF